MENIKYKLATGEIIVIETTKEIASFLEQSDRQLENQKRRDKSHKDKSLDYLLELGFDVPALCDPFMLLCEKESRKKVVNELKRQLHGRQFQCAYLKFVLNYRNKDISNALGISPAAVTKNTRQAVARLRQG